MSNKNTDNPTLGSKSRLSLEAFVDRVAARLTSERKESGHWEGRLSSSALSTATAVCALTLVSRNAKSRNSDLDQLARRGWHWLATHQNPDGGYGDTEDSPSNISTTTLCWAALSMIPDLASSHSKVVASVEQCLRRDIPDLTPQTIAETVSERYGIDRTFSVPILTMCALAGKFGQGRSAWEGFPTLPFELAACPHQLFALLGLPVVSYALPALVAIGQCQHHHRPSRNPLVLGLRSLTRKKTLRVLARIQPESGGFLEATPLTSFVTMSLASCGEHNNVVTKKAVTFLTRSMRDDGSWPIDTDLATWVTTLSIKALAGGGRLHEHLPQEDRSNILKWIATQQGTEIHPYTHAKPGAWAWTDLSGGVPDADDTPGALLALRVLATENDAGRVTDLDLVNRAEKGVAWLLDLQNRDGGIPTFCRGWGKLPFDESSPDLTAHALLSWEAWRAQLPNPCQRRILAATLRAGKYLVSQQRENGSWIPLWFGNQYEKLQQNPLYGTSRVLRVGPLETGDPATNSEFRNSLDRGLQWILSIQQEDGGFGGSSGIPATIEETALAVESLAGFYQDFGADSPVQGVLDAIQQGCEWLQKNTQEGTIFPPSPIGLYFAKLWYHERLYPLIFTASALERAKQVLP